MDNVKKTGVVFVLLWSALLVAQTADARQLSMAGVTPEVETYRAQGHTDARWDDYVTQGFRQYAGSDFGAAQANLLKAYELGCRDGLLLFRLMNIYVAQDQCATGIRYGQEAVPYYRQQYPEEFKGNSPFQAMGDCSEGEAAIEFYRQGLEVNPSDVSIRLNMAHALVKMGRLEQARAEFLAVVDEGQISSYGYGVAYKGLGDITKDQGDLQAAVQYYKKGYDLGGNGLCAWALASTYEELKDYPTARRYWQAAADFYGTDSEWGQRAAKRVRQLAGY